MTQQAVRIPADVDRPDRLVAGLTGRQLIILVGTAMLLYLGWSATRTVLPLPVFGLVAVPVGGGAALLALGQRDGMSLDRLLLAAIRQHLQPRHRVAAPEGLRPPPAWITQRMTVTATDATQAGVAPAALHLPAETVTDTGVVDLGEDGLAVLAVASTVNFGLRTPAEQDALVAVFGRYLHSLTNPIQILIRAERLDLSGQIAELRAAAPGLSHPALEQAAREHADYLSQLAGSTDLLRRQVLLVMREPVGVTPSTDTGAARRGLGARGHRGDEPTALEGRRRAAEARLARRLSEAVDLLSPAGIVVTPLDAGQATAVLTAACNPDSLVPPSAGVAGADDVITTAAEHDRYATDEAPDPWTSAETPAPTDTTTAELDDWEVYYR
jgi:hypothetical protein